MADKLNAEWFWAINDHARYSIEHFHYSFTVVIGYCYIRKLIVVAANAVFRGEEEGPFILIEYVSKS
jgi:hypothetical protein